MSLFMDSAAHHFRKGMDDVYEFKFPVEIYYRGCFGSMPKQANEKNWTKEQKKITKRPIKNSLELFQMLNTLPTFEEVQEGFTYFFFKDGVKPDWNDNLNAYSVETLFEVTDQFTKFKESQWKVLKSQLEACTQMCLLGWVGSSVHAFESVLGMTVKIRRSRVTLSTWFLEERDSDVLRAAIHDIFDRIDRTESMAKFQSEVQSLRFQQEESSNKSSRASSRSTSQRRGSSVSRSQSREQWGFSK